jgi:hypothetical protein
MNWLSGSTKEAPTCGCGVTMILKSTNCGWTNMFYWVCPKRHFWNESKHSLLGGQATGGLAY